MTTGETTMERQYTTLDRSKWGAGPWDTEPDKVQWIDAATGLDCLAVRNSAGAWCGYVGVTEAHPWFGVSYGTCSQPDTCTEDYCYQHTPEGQVSVHGGITYSDLCQENGAEGSSICHLPFDGRPDHVFWFGFDCLHGGDAAPGWGELSSFWHLNAGNTYRTLDYVRSECASMAKQIALAALTAHVRECKA